MLTGYTIELNEIEGVTDRTGEGSGKSSSEVEKTTNTDALADLFK